MAHIFPNPKSIALSTTAVDSKIGVTKKMKYPSKGSSLASSRFTKFRCKSLRSQSKGIGLAKKRLIPAFKMGSSKEKMALRTVGLISPIYESSISLNLRSNVWMLI